LLYISIVKYGLSATLHCFQNEVPTVLMTEWRQWEFKILRGEKLCNLYS